MSSLQRQNFETVRSIKQYQPEFPLVYDKIYGPYSAITSKEDSLARNFVNLLLTNPGEWPMNPDLGIGIRNYLFESSTVDLDRSLRAKINFQLQKYLPHIKLHSLELTQSPENIDNNTLRIKINCVILNTSLVSIVAYLDKLSKLIIDYKKLKRAFQKNNSLVPKIDTDLFSRQTDF